MPSQNGSISTCVCADIPKSPKLPDRYTPRKKILSKNKSKQVKASFSRLNHEDLVIWAPTGNSYLADVQNIVFQFYQGLIVIFNAVEQPHDKLFPALTYVILAKQPHFLLTLEVTKMKICRLSCYHESAKRTKH